MFDDYPDPIKAKKQEQSYQPQRLSSIWPFLIASILAFIVLLIIGHSHDPHLPQPATVILITATPTSQAVTNNPAMPRMVEEIVPTPRPQTTPSTQPTPPTIVEERLDLIPLYGAGQLITVRVPSHLVKAVAVSYLHRGEMIQQSVCDPTPHDGTCQFPRPVVLLSETRSFSLIVKDEGGGWHFLPFHPARDFLTVGAGLDSTAVWKYTLNEQ